MMRHALGMRATMAAAAATAAATSGAVRTAILAHSTLAAAALPSLSAVMSRTFSSESNAEGSAPAGATTGTGTGTGTGAATPAAAAAPSASSPSGSTAPSRRRQRAWADESTMLLLKERGIVRKRGVRPRPEGSDPHSVVKASLQRGAPKPRPLLPVPAALRGVDKPWMQQELTLHFETPAAADSAAQSAQSFALKMTQWTGMEEIGWQPPRRQRPAQKPLAETEAATPAGPSATESTAVATDDAVAETVASDPADDAAGEENAWVDEPVLTAEQQAAEDELRAQADAGSGTIVWDAALHLAHWIHASPAQRVRGPFLELGSGTGALGLAVQKILAHQPAADSRAVLTDGGKVLELLQKNVANNGSDAVVLPLDWSAVPAFLSQLPISASSPSPLPAFFRTLLCSELLDSIPSAANAHRAFDRQSFATLVEALVQLSRHSLAAQARLDPSATASVEVLFTFEQRGVLSLAAAPDGVLQEQLIEPLTRAGFAIERVEEPVGVYTKQSNMTLLRMRME